MTRPLIALLGRKDEPTDAVEDYCRYLGAALQAHHFDLHIRRVPWETHGWSEALHALRLQATAWRNTWILVQYTALAWGARGFSQKFLRALRILQSAQARIAVVFHDTGPYPGVRLIDRFRRAVQLRVMNRTLALAKLAVFTIPLDRISWLPPSPANSVFIPVGANLPVHPAEQRRDGLLAVAVFGITGGLAGAAETRAIVAAVRHAATRLGRLRLAVFGRHADEREPELRHSLQDVPVDVSVEGVLDPAEVVQRLCSSDVLLFVRGPISSSRGSAIAGISCGLPVVAYQSSETAPPVTEAGVVFVPHNGPHAQDQLNAALIQVLSHADFRAQLAARSRAVYEAHLNWSAIASRFAALLND